MQKLPRRETRNFPPSLSLSFSLSEMQRDASGNGNKSACHLIAATLTPVTGSRGQMELNFTSELAR